MATYKGFRLSYVEKGHAGFQLLSGLAMNANLSCNCENFVAASESHGKFKGLSNSPTFLRNVNYMAGLWNGKSSIEFNL